jgi:hypothetical protein
MLTLAGTHAAQVCLVEQTACGRVLWADGQVQRLPVPGPWRHSNQPFSPQRGWSGCAQKG